MPHLSPVELSASWTVNDVLRCCPASILVLNELGVDTCCGGTETLELAARDAGLTTEALIGALLAGGNAPAQETR